MRDASERVCKQQEDGRSGQAYSAPTVPSTRRGNSDELLPLCKTHVLENEVFLILPINNIIKI